MAWQYLFQLLVALVVADLTTKIPDTAGEPTDADKLKLPTNDPSLPFPVVAGDVLIEAPIIASMPHFSATALYTKVKKLFSSKRVHTGWAYYVGLEFDLCVGPLDELLEVYIGNKLAWSGNLTSGELEIDETSLFGGPNAGGGVYANCAFYPGNATQGADSYLESVNGVDFPRKGLARFVFKGPNNGTGGPSAFGHAFSGLLGESGQVEGFKFRVRAFPNWLGSGFHNVNGSANPAEFLYGVMTGRYLELLGVEGPKAPASMFDVAQWRAKAEQLFNENIGIDVLRYGGSIADLIKEVERHIDGKVIENQYTGLFELHLARGDYDKNTLPVFDASNSRLVALSVSSLRGTVNRVNYTYREKSRNFKKVAGNVYDPGNKKTQSQEVKQTVDFPFFNDATRAATAATRELLQQSTPLHNGKIEVAREGFNLKLGDVFKLNFPERSKEMDNAIMRITAIEYGDFTGSVVVSFVSDVFALAAPMQALVTDGYVDTQQTALDVLSDKQTTFELPYPLLEESKHRIAILAEKPNVNHSDDYNLKINLNAAGYSTFNPRADHAMAFELRTTIPELSASENLGDVDLYYGASRFGAVGWSGVFSGMGYANMPTSTTLDGMLSEFHNLLMINGELLGFLTYTIDSTTRIVTLHNTYRALADTIPKPHAIGDKAFILWQENLNILDAEFDTGDNIAWKALTRNGEDTLNLVDATEYVHVIDGRYDKPLAPINVRVNGGLATATIGLNTELTVSWSHRSKTSGKLATYTDDTMALDSGVTYTLRLYDENDVLVRTETGLTGKTYTWTSADEEADSGLTGRLNNTVRFELEAVQSGTVSEFTYSRTVTRV